MRDMELLRKLTQAFGPSGDEGEIRELIASEMEGFCDSIETDSMGNLTARIQGGGKRIMLAAHMDEIGIMVNHVDKNGFLRFSALGGLYVKDLAQRRVKFKNGLVGVIGSEVSDSDEKQKIEKLYIDIGAKNREEALKEISIGDSAVFCGDFQISGNAVISKALDNRAGCYALIKAAREIKNSKNDLYFVFTSQEEVGLRGAKAAAYSVNPDIAAAVDVTDTGDTPSCPVMEVKAGGGAAVKVMDRSVICDIGVRNMLIECARENDIPYQLEIMADGGTDAGAIQLSKSGVRTGGVSVPTRYIHSPSEMAYISDIEACVKLLKAFAEQ